MHRRLAGFRFEAQPPPPNDVLPRMDIAAFVGFAASGPLDCPVAIEDPAQFAAVFGADVPIAWDGERGEWVSAQLGPAVRAYLRNGGRRCWVVRVADDESAQANRFPIPGVLRADRDESNALALRPAFGWARSQGSWADGVRVGTALTTESFVVQEIQLDPENQGLIVQVVGALQPRDLLRLRNPSSGLMAVMRVERISINERRDVLRYHGTAVWFGPPQLDSPPGAALVTWDEGDGERTLPALRVEPTGENGVHVTLPVHRRDAPPPGTMLRVDLAPDPIWMVVTEVRVTEDGSPQDDAVQVIGAGLSQQPFPDHLPVQPSSPPSGPEQWRCERLRMELRTVVSDRDPLRMGDLDFVPGAARFWGALPTDAELFDLEQSQRRDDHSRLWQQAAAPRFPLAGNDPGLAPAAVLDEPLPLFTVPLSMTGMPDILALPAIPQGAPLERDGLAEFRSNLFVDTDLEDALTGEVMERADAIRYLAPTTRRLRGIHAVLVLEEVTLVAVPDAVQRAWKRGEGPQPLAAVPSPSPKRPAWWHHKGCTPDIPEVSQPEWGEFPDAGIQVICAPRWESEMDPTAEPLRPQAVDAASSITLAWTEMEGENAGCRATGAKDPVYVVEEATLPDFADAREVYSGAAQTLTVYGRSPGDYYYRVRVSIGQNISDWSRGLFVRVGPPPGWILQGLADEPQPICALLAVQRSLLRMCAARGDLLAVLSLPEHYREDETILHVRRLLPSGTPISQPDNCSDDLPLSFGEQSVLSYGAVFHPWLVGREEDRTLRRTPPDGAVCGMMARRALERGAWIAPANERLNGVVALTPPMARERWLALKEAQINLVRQEPYGFVTLSTDTLSVDPDLLQINVRRLLHLLRRIALRLGTDFVFEPHDDVLRRTVHRDIDAVLRDLFARGAFAGRTPDASYQVIMRSTPQDVDQGRLIVDVKVAPSLPMDFLTVRLVQSGGRTVITEER